MGHQPNILTTARAQLVTVVASVVLSIALVFIITFPGVGTVPGFLAGLVAGLGGKHVYEHQSIYPSTRTRTLNELDAFLDSLMKILSDGDEGTEASNYNIRLRKRRRLGRLQLLNEWLDSPQPDTAVADSNGESFAPESAAEPATNAQESQDVLSQSERARLLAAGLEGHSLNDGVPETRGGGNDEASPDSGASLTDSSRVIDLLKSALDYHSDKRQLELITYLRKMDNGSSSNPEEDLDTIDRRLRDYRQARQEINNIYSGGTHSSGETTLRGGQQEASAGYDRSAGPVYFAIRDYRNACAELDVTPVNIDDQPLTSKIRQELDNSEKIDRLKNKLSESLEAVRILTDEPPDWVTPVNESDPVETLRSGIDDGWIGYKTISTAAQEIEPGGKYSQELITPLRDPEPDDISTIQVRLEQTKDRLNSYATIEDRLTFVDKADLEKRLDRIRERLRGDTNIAETHLEVIMDRVRQADAQNEVEMFAYAEALDAFEKAINLTDSPRDYDELLAGAENSRNKMNRELEERPHGIRNGKNVLYPFAEVGDELVSDAKDAAAAGEMGHARAAAKAAELVYDTVAGIIGDPETRKLLK